MRRLLLYGATLLLVFGQYSTLNAAASTGTKIEPVAVDPNKKPADRLTPEQYQKARKEYTKKPGKIVPVKDANGKVITGQPRKMPPLMEVFVGLVKGDECTLVSRGSILNPGLKSGVNVADKFPTGKKIVSNETFFKKNAADIVLVKGKADKNGVMEITEKISQDNIKVIIAVDEEGRPAFKVKKQEKK